MNAFAFARRFMRLLGLPAISLTSPFISTSVLLGVFLFVLIIFAFTNSP